MAGRAEHRADLREDLDQDRAAFEVAAHHEGAHVSYLGPGETQLGRKESVRDTARVLGRMFDAIEYRGFGQEAVETLAACAGVPVWNGLTDAWHPTQMLAGILTITDHCAKPLFAVSLCYLGDGRNNTANSLLVTGGLPGMDMRICSPPALRPSSEVQGTAKRLAYRSGARLTVTEILAIDLGTYGTGVAAQPRLPAGHDRCLAGHRRLPGRHSVRGAHRRWKPSTPLNGYGGAGSSPSSTTYSATTYSAQCEWPPSRLSRKVAVALSSLAPKVKIISTRCASPCGSRVAMTMRSGITSSINSNLLRVLTGFRHMPGC